MKITSISFTKTLQTDACTWHKLGIEAQMEEKDTPPEAIKTLETFVDNYFKEKVPKPEKKSLVPKMVGKKEQDAIDNVFLLVKEKLSGFDNREDAQAYLDTTEFKMTIEAKQLVNNLPLKNK